MTVQAGSPRCRAMAVVTVTLIRCMMFEVCTLPVGDTYRMSLAPASATYQPPSGALATAYGCESTTPVYGFPPPSSAGTLAAHRADSVLNPYTLTASGFCLFS